MAFREVIDRMPMYMKTLKAFEPISMDTIADRHTLGRRLPAREGVHALYENDRAMYVGRSDNLKVRLLDHGLHKGGSETATFAFKIAREQFKNPDALTRRELVRDPDFKVLFREAATRVRQMKARVVGISDPIEQTIFEVYAAMELDTPYNSFENH